MGIAGQAPQGCLQRRGRTGLRQPRFTHKRRGYRGVGAIPGDEDVGNLQRFEPLGHTPLIALSFAAERKDFGDGYPALVENATLFGGDETEEGPKREAAGWLVVPSVANA